MCSLLLGLPALQQPSRMLLSHALSLQEPLLALTSGVIMQQFQPTRIPGQGDVGRFPARMPKIIGTPAGSSPGCRRRQHAEGSSPAQPAAG
jgi:hypothetical protein